MEDRLKSRTSTLLGIVLALGSMIGIGLSIIFVFAAFIKASGSTMYINSGLALALMALYGWTLYVGMQLAMGHRQGWRWAIILFASQIPMLATPGFQYEWFSGVLVDALVQPSNPAALFGMNFNVGAASFFYIDGYTGVPHYGINLFALLAVILLVSKRRSLMARAAATPDAPDDD